jgi:hypothetical protein
MNAEVLHHFAEQAKFCDQFGSPFTARLVEALARDIAAGGPTAGLVADWPRSPRADALALRLAGALHCAAIGGRDPALRAEYPPLRVDWDAERVWCAARAFLEREPDWIAEFLRSAPQTNETRRSIALLAGFLTLAQRFPLPFDVLELGASAGLNLCWDRFAYHTATWSWGPQSPVRIETDWRGAPPPLTVQPRVRSRAACDLDPPDLRQPEQRRRLRAYIWADQPERLARFEAAVDLALEHGVAVECADAAEWIEQRLARRADDALTVVYHSIFYQYPRQSERQRIRQAIERAGAERTAPLAWLRVEPEAVLDGPADSPRILIDLVTWPGGERRTLGATDGHIRFIDAFL